MRSFDEIHAVAASVHGGPKALAAKLAERQIDVDLATQTDDRLLSCMASAVFSSGFSWQVIHSKWSGFEAAFDGFNPRRVAAYDDEKLDQLLADVRIVRNGAKISATIANARFVLAVAAEHGSFARFLALWRANDQIGLMNRLKKDGSRLGGSTAMYFLRFAGWDAFITSQDVVRALIREGVIDKEPSTKADGRAVQQAFNVWAEESGRSRRDVSRLLALSVG